MKLCQLSTHRSTLRLNRILSLIAMVAVATYSPVLAEEIGDIKDIDITLAVDRQLEIDEEVTTDKIDVSTQNGIVTLSGSVENVLARDRSADIAAMVKGVRSIINLIEVQPVPRTQRQIRADVEQALQDDPATDLFEINIDVRKGTVILIGRVESWQEKNLCTLVAKGVIGVKDVKSNIEVSHRTKRLDGDIKAEIERRLAYDVWIDDAAIDVKVHRGHVALSGTVASLSGKTRAFRISWVAGVTSVEDNDLVVNWSRLNKMRRTFKDYPRKSDKEVKQALKEAFVYDTRLSPFNLSVSVENGVVTLSGQVNNLKAKQAAEEYANNTVGVWMVKNNLKVRPGIGPHKRPMPDMDAELARKVRLALLRNPYTHQHEIGVTVSNYRILLEGTVKSNLEKEKAEDVASAVKGVAAVMNNLRVKRAWIPKGDWEIEKDIEDELWWSPFVDADEISVTVTDGIATLFGVVDTLRDRRVATKNAYEGGARQVRNLLKVRYGPDNLRP